MFLFKGWAKFSVKRFFCVYTQCIYSLKPTEFPKFNRIGSSYWSLFESLKWERSPFHVAPYCLFVSLFCTLPYSWVFCYRFAWTGSNIAKSVLLLPGSELQRKVLPVSHWLAILLPVVLNIHTHILYHKDITKFSELFS